MSNEDLKFQYEATLSGAYKQHAKCKNDYVKSIWSGIIRKLKDEIYYMEHGCFPVTDPLGEKRNKEKREVHVDIYFLAIQSTEIEESAEEKQISLLDKKILSELLSVLSKREKQCYLLKYQDLFSNADIAAMLGIEESTVATFIERAQQKINVAKNKSLVVFEYMKSKETEYEHS